MVAASWEMGIIKLAWQAPNLVLRPDLTSEPRPTLFHCAWGWSVAGRWGYLGSRFDTGHKPASVAPRTRAQVR